MRNDSRVGAPYGGFIVSIPDPSHADNYMYIAIDLLLFVILYMLRATHAN